MDKLGHLADKCERLNTNLSQVVTESHKILDNSFFSSQVHLTNHVANLNYDACIDIVIAMDVHSEYMETVQELVEAEGRTCEALVWRGEELAREAENVFRRVQDVEGVYKKVEEAELGTDYFDSIGEDSEGTRNNIL